MKTLLELSGNKVAVIESYLQSTAETLNGKKLDELIPCVSRIEKISIVNYITGERMFLEAADLILISDEVRLTTANKVMTPLSELI